MQKIFLHGYAQAQRFGLIDPAPGPKGPHPNRISAEIETAILDRCLAHTGHGALRLAHELMSKGVQVSSGGVRGVLPPRPADQTPPLLRLEKIVADRKTALNDEQIRLLERFSPEFRERHIEAPHTSALVAVDTHFVRHLERVGKVYLQSVIDCHSQYAWGRLYTTSRSFRSLRCTS